ncbi:MAG: metal ABC transporter permease [Bacillati bacterium ANGP1]|uniref:Metal ABC transporter permease n=1 Tax=Candidatus Segetimicrobium genomatis TaxID=2569760 RepID=A0A537M936_9BACT|nr:MAG: metal ABC transporter permease [Terrabacteria group bacterium ANGP1]
MSLWHYAFVQQALVAGAVTAIVAGFVGPFVTARNMGFAVHGLAEVGFTGAAGAILVGLPAELGLLAACFSAALAIGVLGVRLRERDIAIGTILAFGLGLGVLFLSLYTRYATEAFSILFGTIMAVSRDDVVRSAVVGAVVLVALAVVYRPLRFATVDPEAAEARGVPMRVISAVFLLILALAVAEAAQVVGVLLVLTLLITPAGAAQRLTPHPGLVILYSVVIAVVATVGGIACGVVTSLPVSFFVASISLAVYLTARLLGPRAPATRRAAA